MRSIPLVLLLPWWLSSLLFLGCSSESCSDKPLKACQGELLDLAFEAVTKMPLNPHVKDRSAAQEAVVDACLELDQPRRALRYIQEIANWRQGAAYADLAFYCAEHGQTADVQQYLDLANQIADRVMESEHAQAWRRDRVRAKIARTHALMRKDAKAAEFVRGAEISEPGRVEVVRVRVSDASALDGHIDAMEAVLKTGTFDQIKHALDAGAALFDRLYEDEKRRKRVEETLRAANKKLPFDVRIDVLCQMAEVALARRDLPKALALVKEARTIMEGARWLVEQEVPLRARLASLRYRAGEREEGAREVDAALALFDKKREAIVDIYRAAPLRAVAEAYHAMGDRTNALKIYKQAVEAGVKNPNSRPRADDLSATCCSMALHRVEPDADLKRRLIEVCNGLDHPW